MTNKNIPLKEKNNTCQIWVTITLSWLLSSKCYFKKSCKQKQSPNVHKHPPKANTWVILLIKIINETKIDASDSNWIRTHNHLIPKRTLNHLAKLAIVC